MLFTSLVNPFGASNTLQIKVSLDIANVLTIFTRPYIDMTRDDQMFSIFLSLGNFSCIVFFTFVCTFKAQRQLTTTFANTVLMYCI